VTNRGETPHPKLGEPESPLRKLGVMQTQPRLEKLTLVVDLLWLLSRRKCWALLSGNKISLRGQNGRKLTDSHVKQVLNYLAAFATSRRSVGKFR
jgi:hypothetical protein